MSEIEKEYEEIFGDPPPYLYFKLEPEEWGELLEKCIKTKKPAWQYISKENPNEQEYLI